MIDLIGVPVKEPAREQVESLMAQLPAVEACAVVEHRFGVLPLIEDFFPAGGVLAGVAAGRTLGSLGLFTPTPEPGWGAAAVEGEPSGAGLRLRGQVRLPSPLSGASLVLVRLEGPEHRLAWLEHGAPGVERRGSRTGGPAGGGPCWLEIEGARAGSELVSGPVSLAPGSNLCRRLEDAASVWALAAASLARDGVRALRRAARTTGHRGTAFATSQWVALGIAEVEIEADLTAGAAQRHLALAPDDRPRGGGLALAAAAAGTLSAVARRTIELRDQAGLELDGPLTEASTVRSLHAFFGGPLMLEAELARILGIGDLPAQETGG